MTEEERNGVPDDLDGWLEELDAALQEAEQRAAKAREEETTRLEQRFRRLRQAIGELDERMARAKALGAAELIARIEEMRRRIDEEVESIVQSLGYDPLERLREEEERQKEAARASSRERLARYQGRIGNAQTETDLSGIAKEIGEGLHKFEFEDALRVHQDLSRAFERIECRMPAPVQEFLDEFEPLAKDPSGPLRFAELAERVEAERKRIAFVNKEIHALHQRAIQLETGFRAIPVRALEHRINEICCRAKLLQREHGDVLTEKQQQLLHNEVFGKLGSVQRAARTNYIPGLNSTWWPENLAALAEDSRKAAERIEAAMGDVEVQRAASEAKEQQQRARQLEERVRVFEQWMLAELYRLLNEIWETPGDESAAKKMRECAAHCLQMLESHKDRLPELLLPFAPLFEEGPQFRWLRKRFAVLVEEREKPSSDEPSDEPAKDESAEEEPVELQTLTGKCVFHPSVERARRVAAGKRLLILGGTPDEARRAKIQSDLDAALVEWTGFERNEGLAHVQQAAERVASGSFDIAVYLLGFLAHKATGIVDEAARGRRVLIARVPRGCGVVGIAEAISIASARSGLGKDGHETSALPSELRGSALG